MTLHTFAFFSRRVNNLVFNHGIMALIAEARGGLMEQVFQFGLMRVVTLLTLTLFNRRVLVTLIHEEVVVALDTDWDRFRLRTVPPLFIVTLAKAPSRSIIANVNAPSQSRSRRRQTCHLKKR